MRATPPRRLANQADRSIAAADGLLRALLNLAAGGRQGGRLVRPIPLKTLLDDLHPEFLPIAADKAWTCASCLARPGCGQTPTCCARCCRT